MKKIVSLLIVMAMLMAFAPTVFAASESGNLMIGPGATVDWQAPATGTVTISTETGSSIAVDGGNTFMGVSGTFSAVEGQTYTFQNFGSGFEIVYWSIAASDTNATSGTVAIESYSWGEWTAPKDGTVKITLDTNGEVDVVVGRTLHASLASGETMSVTAGTTYAFYPYINTVNSVLAWEYVEGDAGDSGASGDAADVIPNGGALALGENNVELTYAMMAAEAPYWTYTATENGTLTVTVASIDGNSNLGPAFGRGMCTLLVGETDGAYTNTAAVEMTAGETVNIAVLYTVGMTAVPAVLDLSYEAAADLPTGNTMILGDNNVVLEAGDADGETYTFIATEDGALKIDITAFAYDEGFGMGMTEVPVQYLGMVFSRNYVFYVNGEQVYDITATVNVTAGAEVTIQLASPMMRYATEATITLAMDDGSQDGGDAEENLNSQYQGAGTYADPYVIPEIPVTLGTTMTPEACDLYFVYEATEAGVISFGESEAFVWTEIMGYLTNQNSNPIQVAAGDVVIFNIFCYTPGDYYVDIFFEAGATLPEGGDDSDEPVGPSEPDGSMGNPFIITELPWSYTAEGFHDVYANFTATEACTLKITYVEGNYISGLVSFDKFSDEKYYLIYVEAGETVNINPWGNESGTYELTLYVPEGGDDEVKLEATDAAIGKGGIVIPFTPDVNGTLSVTISGTPGYELKVVNAADDSTVGLPKKSSQEQTVTFELQAGVAYNICVAGYDPIEWDYADATISYVCTFEASEQEVVKEDLLETSVELVVGEQNVELLPNAVTTLFNFYAPEAGVYTITLPEGVTAALYSVAWTAYQTAEGNTLVFTATAEGQGFLVGLTSEEASFNVSVEKTGTYTPPAATTYLPYEPTTPVDTDFQMPEGDVTNVDITEAHTAVLGDDGFYHLDTVDGPILYVNLNSNGFTLATLLEAGAPITMRGEKFQDENGDLFCYDYMNMIAFGDYYSYSLECDYYPLNADLMAFFQDYGAAQGWYNANFSNFEAIKSGEFNEESAWMVALVYIADDSGNQGGNQGGNTGDNPQTSDIGIIAASVTMTLSAIVGTALLCKKKEN